MNECSGLELLTLRGICRCCVISLEAPALFSRQKNTNSVIEGLLTSPIPPDTYWAHSANS